MKKEKTYWYDLKPSDNNDGFIYGINYIDNDEVIECEWFKTKQERNKKMENITDEDGNELEGVIGCDEDGYIFDEEWFEEWLKENDLK
jgi:hypothetical protein